MHFQPVVFAVVIAVLVVSLTALARRLPIPTPILQVLAGFAVSLIPGVTIPELDPNLVFFVFLPPILWSAAMFTSVREFKRNFDKIGTLAIGLVIVTTAVIAIVARKLFPDIPWPVAVALGAIISPPDAVAATAIVSRLRVPHRVITVLEGESLINDASALVLYRSAVAAAITGYFSWGESIVRFFIDAGIGSLIGLLVAWLIVRALRLTRDPLAEALLTLAGPYVAWSAAEALHVSAVLACVAGGVYLQQGLSTAVGPSSRLQSRTVWELVVFLVNALIFLLLGAQFGVLIHLVPPNVLASVFVDGAIITGVAILVRLLWVPMVTALPLLSAKTRRRAPKPNWKSVSLVVVDEHARRRVARNGARTADRHRQRPAVPASYGDHPHHDVRHRADASHAGALTLHRWCASSASRPRRHSRRRSGSRAGKPRGAAPKRSRISRTSRGWTSVTWKRCARSCASACARTSRRVDDSRGAADCAWR